MTCRICLEDEGTLISACDCTGTCAAVHLKCLQRWIDTSNATSCEICLADYNHMSLRFRTSHSIAFNVLCLSAATFGLFHGGTIVVANSNRELSVVLVDLAVFNTCHLLFWSVAYHTNRKEMYISILWLCSVTFSMMTCLSIFDIGPYALPCYVTNVLTSILGACLHKCIDFYIRCMFTQML